MESPASRSGPPTPARPAAAPGGGGGGGLWRTGELLAWLGGLVLTLSAFMGWYSISGDVRGNLAVLGWNTGTIGKLVFVVGVIVLLLLALRAFGIELPPSVPDGIVIAALGLVATILVLVRLIDIPETFQPSVGRGIGIWLSLLAALLLIVAGLLKSGEDA
ncbi:MAG TPA: hypothetical protein VD695_09145 [Gaiellaceae bacterium]|nr:hypothetical protein [Gaiellaceae bacterium]